MTTIVNLTPQDNLPSLLARFRTAPDERVLIVVPPEVDLVRVDLLALRREALACGRGVALVTADPELRAVAGAVGISTFRSPRRGELARWQRIRPAPALRLRPVGPAETVPPPGPGLFAPRSPTGYRPVSFLRAFVARSSPWWVNLWLLLLLVLLFGGLVGALAVIIPQADITAVPGSEPVQVTVAMKAVQDAAADPEAGILPGKPIRVQVTGEGRIASTGRRHEPSAKAKGQVMMVNRTARPLTIPAGTIVATATGDDMRFTTTEQVGVEPNGRAQAPIEAVLPGPTGNVRAATITRVEGPLSLSLVASNEAPTGGGGSAEVGVVTEDDQGRLQAQLLEELKQKALAELREKLEPGVFLPPGSVTYLAMSPTFTPFVGEVSPELSLSMSVQAEGLAVDTRAGEELALNRLQASMPPGTRLISDTVRFIPGAIVVEDPQTVSFSITAEGTLLHAVDTNAVRSTVAGMKPAEASATLADRFELAQPPQIHLGPDWLPLIVPTELPILPWRMRVNVDWDTAAALARP